MQSFAVIPAAGRSARMGQPKLLLPWGSATVIEHVLAVWRASRVSHVVVVAHPDDLHIAELATRAGALVVQPKVAPPEMKVSVCRALERIVQDFHPEPSDAWLLAPADVPGITTAAIDRLLDRYEELLRGQAPPPIVAASQGQRRRHPVLFPWRLAAAVPVLGSNEGLDALVARNPFELVDVSGLVRFDDIDTPKDYRRAQADGPDELAGGL